MSMRFYTWAWQQHVRRVAQHVLLYLVDRSDGDGQCWPKVETIAEATGWDYRTIRRALRQLERDGLIKRERRHRSDGVRSSDRITLCLGDTESARQVGLGDSGAAPRGLLVPRLEVTESEQIPASEPRIDPTTTASSYPRTRDTQRGTRLPDDWSPTPDLIGWQRREGIPDDVARRELDKFRDYWAAAPGAKGRKRDWPATWRNWLRRAVETPHRPTRQEQTDGIFERAARRMGVNQ